MVGTNKSKRFGAHRNITRLDFVGFASFSTLDTTSLTTLGCPRLTLPTILPPLYHRLPLSSAANHRLFTFRFSSTSPLPLSSALHLLLLPNTNTHHNLGIWIKMKEEIRGELRLTWKHTRLVDCFEEEERHLAWLNKKAASFSRLFSRSCVLLTTSSLFTVSDEASLFVVFFHQLDSSITELLINISSEGVVEISLCAFTSDGGINMAFADHSGFEFDGGSVKLLLARDLNSVLIANVATTGDGAV
ncbi:hypothetical protein BLNAU_24128 [Blattamonas nauphoetae]|uniref:Uncharacterized protein n=1 Tax=Blattamonas nauphoetae TaxID=2049346 RepID=A0ABQ9WNN0_9EUKA|nr:hypothetical protein BLNAU_24128 [Blattamonas nauphoetae]